MNILLIDIDSVKPSHLGCYGYHRNTSPNIDRVARNGILFHNCYASDTPCLPSRSAFATGRYGIHTGVVNHGGVYADPYSEGDRRSFRNAPSRARFTEVLRENGYYTGLISSFGTRHSAWWICAGFNEVWDCGRGGSEMSDEVTQHALSFFERNRNKDKWFIHLNVWDPHNQIYLTEQSTNPFADEPLEKWMNEEIIMKHRNTYGTHSANAPLHVPDSEPAPRQVKEFKTLEDYKVWVDAYDTCIRSADSSVGKLLSKLEELSMLNNTAVIITSDHGENHGELNIYGDHQTADYLTSRIPMILNWPGMESGANYGFHYQFDIGATILEYAGCEIPSMWDGISGKGKIEKDTKYGREYVVVSHGAWSAQRGVIFDDYILIKSYMDGLKDFPRLMLFNRIEDPHEMHNLADSEPEIVQKGLSLLQQWVDEQMERSTAKEDPLLKSVQEGGPYHTRGRLEEYVDYYRENGMIEIAETMLDKYSTAKGYKKTFYED